MTGFRFHDFRHDLGTKLLRETGNLKLVQRALNHADLKTTTRYAHVLDDDVAEAMERVTESPKSVPEFSAAAKFLKGFRMLKTAYHSLGDWGSRVRISALRPTKSKT